jgi:WD40 repeat protein
MVRSSPLTTNILAHSLDKDSSEKSDQAPKRLSIFSVHVHPDGSRIATGGLDAKIRIWSTKPILNSASEQSNRPPKSLCTLTMHTGPVLCVRWANSGRWLASGSDDEIVMIWDLDPFVLSFFSFDVVLNKFLAARREVKCGAQMRSISRVGNL